MTQFRRRAGFLALFALIGAGQVLADVLGDPRLLSRVGEPLHLVIPMTADAGGAAITQCLALKPTALGDGVPHILTARVAVERNGDALQLTITTPGPVQEPMLRLSLQTDCSGTLRNYTVLLDPAALASAHRDVVLSTARMPPVPAPRVTSSAPAVETEVKTGLGGAPQPPPIPDGLTGPAAPAPVSLGLLQAENAAMKREILELRRELERRASGGIAEHGLLTPVPIAPARPAHATVITPGTAWDGGWPVYAAFGGLASLTVGGLLWRRRHFHTQQEWQTGAPTHGAMSRTSLGDPPVPFHADAADYPHAAAGTARNESTRSPVRGRLGPAAPASLLLQPSTEDLGRDLESELAVAERIHAALEREHPEIVDRLIRTWGSSASRIYLADILGTALPGEVSFSNAAMGELQLLSRIAAELAPTKAPLGDPSLPVRAES